MIDTMKIYTEISEDMYKYIESKTDVTCKFNIGNDFIYNKITNGSLERLFW